MGALQICTYLDPQDLFVLSNTNKVFRSIVTGPHAPPLWIAARERVGLPELELPMPDLQYAQLLFGRGCSFCVRKNAGKADVFYRARICTACLKEQYVPRNSSCLSFLALTVPPGAASRTAARVPARRRFKRLSTIACTR